MANHETWEIVKNFGIVLNYLLIPIGIAVFKAFSFFSKIDKRITYLEILHKVKGCHAEFLGDIENNVGGD